MTHNMIIQRIFRQVKNFGEFSAKIWTKWKYRYMMNSFGENLRYYRTLAKLSQAKLGEKLGFSARTVSDWECNNTEPNLDTLKELVKILNSSYEALLDYKK